MFLIEKCRERTDSWQRLGPLLCIFFSFYLCLCIHFKCCIHVHGASHSLPTKMGYSISVIFPVKSEEVKLKLNPCQDSLNRAESHPVRWNAKSSEFLPKKISRQQNGEIFFNHTRLRSSFSVLFWFVMLL